MKTFTHMLLAAGLALIGQQASAQQVLDNYENTRLVDYPATQGTITVVANPGSNAVNSSTSCAGYARDGSQSYANIALQPKNGVKFANVAAYVAGTRRISLKIRSSAPAGTPLLIVLQNRAKAIATPYVYPQGNFSGYFNGATTVVNAWETVTFTYSAVGSDPTVTANDIDQLALYVAPNSSSSLTYYLDDITGPEITSTTTAARSSASSLAALATPYPNPSTTAVHLPYSLEKAGTVSLGLYDMMGRRVATAIDNQAKPAGDYSADLNTANLARGLYTCRLVIDGVALTRPLSVE
ncbi:MAG: T9SS type A sorting domain-containing protein [Hymenobacter sp.]|nr:MAG: T9SS type A sorting domain-containing protein [Hymenobacter sp.]